MDMKKGLRFGLLAAASLILLAGLAACGANPATGVDTGPLTEDQVTGIVENMLAGYNAGDYATFSRDLSEAMRLVVSEELFQEFITESQATLGQFQSIASIEQVESDETHSTWRVTAQFANGAQEFNITFDHATGQIEGMDFGPAG
jgi:hypothetical protein